MNSSLIIFPEPGTEFRYLQVMAEPHDGLTVFGPCDTDTPSHPQRISYGVVGTEGGLKKFAAFCARLISGIPSEGNARLWPLFPGFEAAFLASWPSSPMRSFLLDEKKLIEAAQDKDANKRAGQVVEKYLEGISGIAKHDDVINVIICIVPDIIYVNCRPQSHVTDGTGENISVRERNIRAKGQTGLFASYDPDHYQYSVDFRRQIKARAMEFQIPIQIVRESTLRLTPLDDDEEGRGLTTLSDRAWNLSVALFYKSGGKPWRLASARDGVCYIGIAYRLAGKKSACCAAQMFLDTGDGIVFMGEYGPWYSKEKKEFHLTKDAARRLLLGVLKSYKELGGKPLKEIFLHCRSSLDKEEFSGFQEACPAGVLLVGVQVAKKRQGLRLFREGTRPVLRGTFWRVNDRTGYLWASGFKPRLGTYDGWETPSPLRIVIQRGTGDITQIAKDILGLTKLNYNACRLGESEPVTIKFSDDVGEILVSNPTVKASISKFKFYI